MVNEVSLKGRGSVTFYGFWPSSANIQKAAPRSVHSLTGLRGEERLTLRVNTKHTWHLREKKCVCECLSSGPLTNIKLKALVLKGVCAAPSLIMLLQDHNPLPSFGQKRRCCQASHTAADHHRIQGRGNAINAEPCEVAHSTPQSKSGVQLVLNALQYNRI